MHDMSTHTPHPLPLRFINCVQTSSEPIFIIHGEVVFEAGGWIDSYGESSAVSWSPSFSVEPRRRKFLC